MNIEFLTPAQASEFLINFFKENETSGGASSRFQFFRTGIKTVSAAQGTDRGSPVESEITQLLEKVSDTRMAAGSDAMMAALVLYGIAKAAGQGSNLDDTLAQVGGRFARKPRTKTTPATKPAA